ncbi:MAG: hypothetical protein ACE5GX_18280 [Thermoanaerobaculia bacterium]
MRLSLIAASLAALTSLHCAKTPPPPPELERVENADLGIAIAALPEVFSVASASGPTIELATSGESGTGRAVIAQGPEERFGINLVEAVKERKAWFEAAGSGRYFGNRELGTPIGTAFTARGAYDTDSGPVEETWVYTIHPMANRLLTITYTYPTGQSQDRVGHLLELLGEIEGMIPPEAAPDSS